MIDLFHSTPATIIAVGLATAVALLFTTLFIDHSRKKQRKRMQDGNR